MLEGAFRVTYLSKFESIKKREEKGDLRFIHDVPKVKISSFIETFSGMIFGTFSKEF